MCDTAMKKLAMAVAAAILLCGIIAAADVRIRVWGATGFVAAIFTFIANIFSERRTTMNYRLIKGMLMKSSALAAAAILLLVGMNGSAEAMICDCTDCGKTAVVYTGEACSSFCHSACETGAESWLQECNCAGGKIYMSKFDSCDDGCADYADIVVTDTTPILYVNSNAAGANTGKSWDDAYKNLNDALNQAGTVSRTQAKDETETVKAEIWVAAGTYTPGTTPESSFYLKSNVAVYGGFDGTETSRGQRDFIKNKTVLSGADICRRVVTTEYSGNFVFDGFTVTKAKGDEKSYGAMYVYSKSIVSNCTFTANQGMSGGGMYVSGSGAVIRDCIFTDNSASWGAGMYISGSPTVTRCTFARNKCNGIFTNDSPVISYCTFDSNDGTQESGYGSGGGVYVLSSLASPIINNCTFSNNKAYSGGGICNIGGNISLSNCTFSKNTVSGYGGGASFDTADATITNCTFAFNTSSKGGGGLSVDSYNNKSYTVSVKNTLIAQNSPDDTKKDDMLSDGEAVIASSGYNLVQNDSTGYFKATGDIVGKDPQVSELAKNGGLTQTCALQAGSPAIDAGTGTGAPEGDQRGYARKGNVDIGAYELSDEVMPLEAPVALPATNGVYGFIASWSSVSNVECYYFDLSQRSDFSPFVSGYQNLRLTETSRGISGLNPGETYFYRVRAYRADGAKSPYSNTVSVTLEKNTGITALTPTNVGICKFTALWSRSVGAAGYYLDVSPKSDFSVFADGYQNKAVTGAAVVGASHEVTGLIAGRTYYYRVRAYFADGKKGNYSNTVSVSLSALTQKPVTHTSVNNDPFSLNMSWGGVDCAGGYLLDVSTEKDFSTFLDDYKGKTVAGNSCKLENIAPDTTYYWRIKAYSGDPADTDNLATGDYSDKVETKTPVPPNSDPKPPLGCYLSNNIVKEKAPAGTVVGTFTASDLDLKATHTFKLESAEYFAISGNTLKVAKEIPYNTSGYSVRVSTTNNSNKLSRYDSFTIDILWAKEIYKAEDEWYGYKETYFYYLSKKEARRIKHGKETYQGPGGLIHEYNYEEGVLHGTCMDYYGTKKSWERNYDKGELHGASKRWNSDGSLSEEGTYTDGKRTGLWTYYLVGGAKSERTYSYEENKLITKAVDYRSNGSRSESFTKVLIGDIRFCAGHGYVCGEFEGTYERWNEDGKLLERYEYSEGRKNGPFFTGSYSSESETITEGTYADNVLHGAWSEKFTYKDGYSSSAGNFNYGKKDGTWTWTWDSDSDKVVATYENDILHGPYSISSKGNYLNCNYKYGKLHGAYSWNDGGGLKINCSYRNGVLHGFYDEVFFRTMYQCGHDYLPSRKGNMSNGGMCGVWQLENFCRCNIYGGCYLEKSFSYDAGPCKDSGDDSEDDPSSGSVSGRVTDGAEDLPLDGVSVYLSGNSASTGTDGYYRFTGLKKGDYTLNFVKSGFHEESESLTLGKSSVLTINKKLQALSEKPIVKGVKVGSTDVKDIKFLVVDAEVDFFADVEWDKGGMKNITFNLKGKDFISSTGSYRFNLLNDFTPSNGINENRLIITAENIAGQKSEPFTVYPVVMPVPGWLESLGKLEYGGTTYTVSVDWPEEPVEILLSEKKLGSLWTLWGIVPFVGGREFGIPESQAGFELSYNPLSGEGEVGLKGSTGFKAAGGKIIGTVGGGGEFGYKAGQGLVWNQGFLILGISGEISKTVGPVTLFPPLEGAVNLPLVGSAIKWFNSKVSIEGKVGAGANVKVGILGKEEGLGFNNANGDVGNKIGLAMAVDLYAVNVELAGEASTSVYWQAPANPGYLRKFEAKLEPSLTFSRWGLSKKFSQEYSYSYPGTSRTVSRTVIGPGPMKAVPRDFLNHGEYSRFKGSEAASLSERRSARQDSGTSPETSEQEDSNGETKIIENVYPYAEPALAENKGNAGIAFVYFDPTRRDLQATDIYLSYFSGAGYSVPAPAQKDSRAEYSPNIAFDRNGNIIAVWERIKNENLTADGESEDAMSAMTKEMEIVYAVYYPNSGIWTQPVAVTDNAYLDHKPVLKTGRNGNIMLFWVSSQNNELFGTSQKPDKINYSIWTGAGFEKTETVPQDFGACLKYSYAYDGRNIFIAYIKDTDGDFGTSEDEEIFYVNFDGEKWNTPVQLTRDAEADDNPQLVLTESGYPELVWLKGTTLARLTDWTQEGVYQIIRCGSESAAFTDFRLFKDPEDRLVVLWQGLNKDADPDLFYSVYDPENNLWSKDLQLTDDPALEKAFRGVFSDDGTLHLVFNRQNLTSGANDLYHKTFRFSYDLEIVSGSLQAVSDTEEEAAPGKAVNLICKVRNSGDLTISPKVCFYFGDPDNGGQLIGTATVEPAELRGGEEGEAKLAWTVPSDKTDYAVYAVADPDNTIYERDESDNKASFNAVKPDLEAIQCKVDRHGDGITDIIAVFRNKGTVSAKNVKISYRVNDQELNIVTVPEAEAGAESQALFTVFADTAFTGTDTKIQILLDSDSSIDESDENNNRATAYTGNPVSPLRCEFGGVNPGKSETQTLTFSDTGTGIDIRSLTIAGDGAADFAVKNDNCSGKNPTDTCTADVVFTPTDTGTGTASLTVAFNTPGKDALEIPLIGTGLKSGDLDGDGQLTLADAVRVLRILTESGTEALPGTGTVMLPEILFYDWSDADVNADGKLGIENAVHILKAVADTE